MAKKSELENVMKRYIDGGKGRDRLRELLKNESVDSRYELLMNVKGVEYELTGLYEAARNNDLESIRYMLDGFPPEKEYNALKIQTSIGRTPLHWAAYRGHSSIITYLLTDLPKQQKYNILKIQDRCGDTALHCAASENSVEAYRAIVASVPYHLLLELLNIKNNDGNSAADIRPELNDEFSLSIAQGVIITNT